MFYFHSKSKSMQIQMKSAYKSLTNESKVRLIAGFVMLLSVIYILSGYRWIPFFLAVDFSLRAFNFSSFSPLARMSDIIVKTLNLPVKPVYLPPKRFAARIGLVFSITMLLMQLNGIDPFAVASILAIFAALESLVGFCAGCYVYNFLKRVWP